MDWQIFTGFIAGVLHGGQLYEFTTYNSSKLKTSGYFNKELSFKSEIINIAFI